MSYPLIRMPYKVSIGVVLAQPGDIKRWRHVTENFQIGKCCFSGEM